MVELLLARVSELLSEVVTSWCSRLVTGREASGGVLLCASARVVGASYLFHDGWGTAEGPELGAEGVVEGVVLGGWLLLLSWVGWRPLDWSLLVFGCLCWELWERRWLGHAEIATGVGAEGRLVGGVVVALVVVAFVVCLVAGFVVVWVVVVGGGWFHP